MKKFCGILFLCFAVCMSIPFLSDWPLALVSAQQTPSVHLDPDRKSGRNKEASGATQIPLGGADENGKISYKDGDRTDWYKVYVKQDGKLEFLVWNRIRGALKLEVYAPDAVTRLAESMPPGAEYERLSVFVQAKHWYYAKVYAEQSGDGGEYSISNIFYDDILPPEIVLPQAEWTTTEETVIIPGTIKDNGQITAIRINGHDILSSTRLFPLLSGEARTFLYTCGDLKLGKNLITIEAEDASKNVANPVSLTIIRQDPPPILMIAAPKANIRFKDAQLVVQGSVLDNSQIVKVCINGQPLSDLPVGEKQVDFVYTLKEIAYGPLDITLTAEDDRGQTSQTTLTIYRDTPPEIVVEHPQGGDRTQETSVEIQGKVKDDLNIAALTINGVDISEQCPAPAEAQYCEFTYLIRDLQYGQNDIVIEARDGFGNQSKQVIMVCREEIPPTIVIHVPQQNGTIAQDVVVVEGMVTDADGIENVLINEVRIQVERSGKFRYALPNLPQGSHDILAAATDIRGNTAQASVHITKIDNTAPDIAILRPENDAKITGNMVVIEVSVRDSDRIEQIYINGNPKGGTDVPGEERLLTHLVEDLQAGENHIEIIAVDVNGNAERQTVKILCLDPDYNSGKDKDAQGAIPLSLNAGTETPVHISYNEGNRTDWYKTYVSEDGELELILTNQVDGDLNFEVYREDQTTQIGNAATPGLGNEYLQLLVTGKGWYYVKVYANQQDDAGNYTLQTMFHAKDLTPPQILLESSEFVTQDASFILEGTVKDNKQIAAIWVDDTDIFASSTVISEDGPGETRTFSYPVKNIVLGANTLTLKAQDAAGNYMPPMKVTINREDLPPTITVKSPEMHVRFRESQLTIQGTVVDNEHISQLFINGQELSAPSLEFQETERRQQLRFSHVVKDIPYGEFQITVVAKDNQGQMSQQSLTVFRDAPPSISVASPQDEEQTTDAVIQVRGVVTDDHKITQITVNGVKVHDVSAVKLPGGGEEQEFTTTVTNLHYKHNEISVDVMDDIGNTSMKMLRIYREETLPVILLSTPSERATVSQEVVEVEGTVQDPDGIDLVTVNGVPVHVDAAGKFSHPIPNLPYGSSEILVIAKDPRGNRSQTSRTVIRMDRQPPEILIESPEDGARTTLGTISVTGTINENDRLVFLDVNGKRKTLGIETPQKEYTFTEVIDGLQDGENVIQVAARDASGNEASQLFRIWKIRPPTIVITQPALSEQLEEEVQTVADTLLIGGYLDTEDVIASLMINGSAIPFQKDKNAEFSYQIQQLESGENTFTLIAIDSLGGETRKTLTILRLNPDYRSGDDKVADGAIRLFPGSVMNDIEIDYDGDRTDWFKILLNTTGKLTINLRNSLPGDLDLEVYGPDKVTKIGESKTPDTGNETLTMSTDQRGVNYYYYAKVTAVGFGDRGRYTIANQFVEVDTIPPELKISEPREPDVWIDREEITITGTAQDNSDIEEVRIVGDRILPLGEVSILGNTANFTYTITKLHQGENILKVIVVDQAENISEQEVRVTVVAKDQPPIIRITAVSPSNIVVTDREDTMMKGETEHAAITIQGTATSPKGVQDVKIRKDGSEVKGVIPLRSSESVKSVQFNERVALDFGANEIIVDARDIAGVSSQQRISIVRTSPKPDESQVIQPSDQPSEIDVILKQLRPGDVYAVVIGIGDYQNEQLNLRYTRNDAQGFYDVLIDPNYGGIPAEHVHLLLDQEATYQNIKWAIGKWLGDQAQERDTVLIYYSGHGAPEGDETYWVTYQADINNLYTTALSNKEIADMLERIKAKRVVTFLDSCYSAATVQKQGTKSVPTAIPLDKFSGEGRVVLSASDGRQLSVELEKYQHGVFTHYLLKGLRGDADKDLDGVMDVGEIWDYVRYQVSEAARNEGHSQTPVFQGTVSAGIPLTYNKPFLVEQHENTVFQAQKKSIIDLYNRGEISVGQFKKALEILKSGQKNRILEDFFQGDLPLEIFKETF